MSTQALAKSGPQAQVLDLVRTDPVTAIMQRYDALEKVANITFPPTELDHIPAMHKPSPTLIKVRFNREDSRKDKTKDTYFITKDQLGLSKPVILKMLTAAGANWKTKKQTPESDLDHIRWSAIVWRRLPDGTPQVGEGNKSWNWDKCQEKFIREAVSKPYENETSDKAKARGLKAALQYRDFADEQTETKALLRAARAIMNIKTSYHPDELDKPFLFVRVVPDLDVSDPEIKRMMAAKLIDSSLAVYGQPDAGPSLPPPTSEHFDEEDEEEDDAGYDPSLVEHEGAEVVKADPSYDPYQEEAPAQSPEEELDAKIRELAQLVGPVAFRQVLAKHNIAVITKASFDQKVVVREDAQALIEGRLSL